MIGLSTLRSGRPVVVVVVVVSSSTLLSALMHAGLPHRELAYGGRDWHKCFVLDEHDRLTEYVEVAQ